jgi:hypothetical protein
VYHNPLNNRHRSAITRRLAQRWQRHGRRAYPQATSILLLCGGGSNNCRHYIFKEDLQRLVNRLGISIRVAHYPPHCSKYNPTEHRLFPHVTRAWSDVIFHTLQVATYCLRRVWTRTGLKPTYAVLDKVYPLQREVSQRFLDAFPLFWWTTATSAARGGSLLRWAW